MRSITSFLLVTALFAAAPLNAAERQPVKVFDLARSYGLDAGNGSTSVGTLCGDEAAVRAKFPAWSAHWVEAGGGMQELMKLSFFTCAWNDAVARVEDDAAASVIVSAPAGRFRVDHPLFVVNGEFKGAPNGATRLVLDVDGWKGQGALMQALPDIGDERNVTVRDLAFEGPGAGTRNEVGAIALEWPDGGVAIKQVSATGFAGRAIQVSGAASTDLQDVRLVDNGTGITLLGCSGKDHRAVRITGSGNGSWFSMGAWGHTTASNSWRIQDVSGVPGARPDRSRLFVSNGAVHTEFERVELSGTPPDAWIELTTAPRNSRVSGVGMRLGTSGKPVVNDLDRKASFGASARPGERFDFCWTPRTRRGTLPTVCELEAPEDSTGFVGGLKSGGPSISIGAVNGPVLTDLQWGYNTSGLFASTSGGDTALQHRISELGPRTLRFPGGTLANFYHPNGLGYGIRAQDVDLVAGTTVYDNINPTFQVEQSNIAAGTVDGNHIVDFIELALANQSDVLYVANLLTGNMNETISAIQQLKTAGVNVTGVELGNEAHLSAYNFRFPTVQAYLAIAQPFATAIQSNFPGMKVGLDGYPPGILKDLGPAGTQRAHDWNIACSNAAFGDALIIHCYSRPKTCTQTNVTVNFKCGADFSQVYANAKLPPALTELASLGNKKIWITEWNIDGSYSHYGNSIAQSMFYADMSFTMAKEPKVTVSTYHNLLSYDDGYNVMRKGWQVHEPRINYWTGILFEDFYKPGNQPQEVMLSGLERLRGFAFLSTTGRQHLYLINRSGSAMDLSSFQGTAANVSYTTLGGPDIAEGSGSNAVRSNGNVSPVSGTVATIADVPVPAYGIVHLSWDPVVTPPPNSPVWRTTFAGTDGCKLKATLGADVVQSSTGKCASISGGTVTTSGSSCFPAQNTTSKVVLMGVTFSNVSPGKWINGRLRFKDVPGRIVDNVTGQVLGNVVVGTRYEMLKLDFGQPVPLNSLIGKANGGGNTAPMTIEGMRLMP